MRWIFQERSTRWLTLGRPGTDGHAFVPDAYAIVDVETTGLSPVDDRVVEIAVVRVAGDGTIVDEYATLLDPGCDVGPTFVHRITNDAVIGAPAFRDIVGDVLARLDGAVIVAHNAPFEDSFLAAELGRLGIAVPAVPALCTLELARNLLTGPNHRLETCCTTAGITLANAHTALGDTRATAALLTHLLDHVGPEMLRYPAALASLPRYQTLARPRTRTSKMRKGDVGWVASMLAQLPVSTYAADPASADIYLAAVGDALADGKVTGDEARTLARLAGQAGLGAAQVRGLHERFLDGMRDAALADDTLTASQLETLQRASTLLDVDGYFADLTATAPGATAKDHPRAKPARTRNATKVWCSPGVPDTVRATLVAAGVIIPTNVTRTLRAVVVDDADTDHPRVLRAAELGIDIIPVAAVPKLTALLAARVSPIDSPMPVSPVDSPATPARQLKRGERLQLDGAPAELTITTRLAGPSELDVVVIGVDADRHITDDRYVIFYNQLAAPDGSIRMASHTPGHARITVDADRLPDTITRLIVVAAIDGPDTAALLVDGVARVDGPGVAPVEFAFGDVPYDTERAVIALEVYRYGDGWRANAVGQGFAGGLAALLTHLGADVVE
jgi:DNA polymerase III epsilon subunit family exonuclease